MKMMVFPDRLIVCPVFVCIIYALRKNYPSEIFSGLEGLLKERPCEERATPPRRIGPSADAEPILLLHEIDA